MKLLQSKDYNLETSRVFLVISMVLIHSFQCFYIFDYNRHLSFYVTIGFVFISGFTFCGVYYQKVKNDPVKNIEKMMVRGLKLFMLFIFCNLPVFIFKPEIIDQLGIVNIIISWLLGTKQDVFAVNALVPIGLTIFISGFLIIFLNKSAHIILIVCSIFFIWVSESNQFLNYYGVKFFLVGVIGCSFACIASTYNWEQFIHTLSTKMWRIVFGLSILIYYMLLFNNQGKAVQVYYHLFPTILILFYVYLLSNSYDLPKYSVIKALQQTLSRHLVFCYLFHIFCLGLMLLFIKGDSIDLLGTLAIFSLVLSLTILSCHLINRFNSNSGLFLKAYTLIFK